MPREIKVRVWMPVHKRMSDCFTIKDFIEMGQGSFSGTTDNVFLEYTGLKDSAGNEIYEGNIAQKAGNRYLIKWCDKTARYVVEVLKAYALLVRGVEFPLWQYVEENGQVNLEVIGNIYEHPELLER